MTVWIYFTPNTFEWLFIAGKFSRLILTFPISLKMPLIPHALNTIEIKCCMLALPMSISTIVVIVCVILTCTDELLEQALEDLYLNGVSELIRLVKIGYYLINRGCGNDQGKANLLGGACYCGNLDMVKELVEIHNCDPGKFKDLLSDYVH